MPRPEFPERNRRDFLKLGLAAGTAGLFAPSVHAGTMKKTTAEEGELLYNGIQLPASWPPRLPGFSLEPMPVPYLE